MNARSISTQYWNSNSMGAWLIALAVTLLVAAGGAIAAEKKSGPSWNDLKADQRTVLAPLQDRWDQDDAARKRKWLGVANRYPKMSSDEQTRVKERMREWAALTSEERRAARDLFREQRELSSDRRQAVRDKWQEYQNLPEDRRRELSARPARTSSKDGASKDGTQSTGPASRN